jgi:predicted alpha/beta-hydrolase family hydrolase
VRAIEIETQQGPARAFLQPAERARAAIVLGHGAGGGVGARDIVAASGVAASLGMSVALVEQPYRVAGRKAPPRAPQLDAAWIAVIEHLRREELGRLPLVTGGRSSGARVACRTVEATGAAAVLCLAFPLQPPRRKGAAPAPSRLGELEEVVVPVLIVQGERDPFGMPPTGPSRQVTVVRGDHSLRTDLGVVAASLESWLRETVLGESAPGAT